MKSRGSPDLVNSLLADTNEGKRDFVLKAIETGDIVVFYARIYGSFGMKSEKRKLAIGTVIQRKLGRFTIEVDKSNIACGIYTAFPADILKFIQDTNVPAARIQALVRGFICRKHQRAAATRIQALVRGHFCRGMFSMGYLHDLMPSAWDEAAETLQNDENMRYTIVNSFIQGGATRPFCQQWPPLCYFWIFVLERSTYGELMKIVSSVNKTTYENLSEQDFPDEEMYDAAQSGIHLENEWVECDEFY